MAVYKRKGTEHLWIEIYRPGRKPLRLSSGTDRIEEARMIESALKMAHGGRSRRERIISAVDAALGTTENPAIVLPLSGLWDAYEQTMQTAGKALAPSTARTRRYACQRFAKWAGEHWPKAASVQDVSPACAGAFADWLARDAPGAKTRRNIIGDLGATWRVLAPRWGLQDVWKHLIPANNGSQHGRAFTPAEETAILQAAKAHGGDWYEACLVARYTGLRYGDIANLKWSAVDLDGRRLKLKPSKTARHGIELGIPLHGVLVDMLAPRARDESGYVFPSHAEAYGHNYSVSPFTPILEAAGIEADGAKLSFHCWRHTFRTMLSAANVPQEIAMALGGWTQASTAGLYSHDWEALRRAVHAIPAAEQGA